MRRLLICLAIWVLSSSTIKGNSAEEIGQWSACGPLSELITDLAIDPLTPSTLYAATFLHGIYKSTDSGSSWFASNNGLPLTYNDSHTMGPLAIEHITPSTLYAGSLNMICKTTDGGIRWGIIFAVDRGFGLFSGLIHSLAIDPLTPSTIYAGTNPFGVYKSTDSGNNWSHSSLGLCDAPCSPPHPYPVSLILIDPHSPSTLYAVKIRDGIYKSTDSGSSWFASNNGLPADASGYTEIFSLAVDPLTPSTLYAGTYGGVYKSTDSGNNWSASSAGLSELYGLSYTQVIALSIDPLTPSTLYAGTDGAGVYKSTDNGNIWTAMNNGLSNLIVSSLAIDPLTPSTLYAVTEDGVYIYDGTISTPGGGGGNHSGSSGGGGGGGCFISTASP